jgi:competence protein ComEA
MRSVFRWNTKTFLLVLVWGASASAQLPAGAGREETVKLCSNCHEIERSVSLRQDRDGWKTTINKMMGQGAQGSVEEFAAALEYLTAHYPANGLPPLNVNTARAIDFESRLSLKRSESALVIKYRAEHGDFKSIEDLKKVPGVDVAKIDAKRASLIY